MKTMKTILAAVLMAAAATAGAQDKNFLHITKTDGTKKHYSQDGILSVTIDTAAPTSPTDYVTFTHGGKTVRVAKMNLGATTIADSPATCFGNHYAWGATEPFATINFVSFNSGVLNIIKEGGYSQENSPYWIWNGNKKYYGKYTDDDQKWVLEPEDDAATVKLGTDWHTPTREELETFYSACGGNTYYSTKGTISVNNDIYPTTGIYWIAAGESGIKIAGDTYRTNGMLFVQQIGDTKNHVFLPAAGRIQNTTLEHTHGNGYYWSSTIYENHIDVYSMQFDYDTVYPSDYLSVDRTYGHTIRPFKKAE